MLGGGWQFEDLPFSSLVHESNLLFFFFLVAAVFRDIFFELCVNMFRFQNAPGTDCLVFPKHNRWKNEGAVEWSLFHLLVQCWTLHCWLCKFPSEKSASEWWYCNNRRNWRRWIQWRWSASNTSPIKRAIQCFCIVQWWSVHFRGC